MTSVREAAYDFFRGHGMSTVFGNPGSTELPFLNQFPADFRYVLGLQEAVVVGMADGYAQASGRPTVVNLHTAPGLGNAMGAICNAHANRSPLVITAGQQVRPMMQQEALLTNRDATVLPRPMVKWSYEPPRAQDIPAALARATHIAAQPPMGPVFLSLPMDDWDAPDNDPATLFATSRLILGRRAAPEPEAVRELADRLTAAARPAMVVGADVDISGAWDAAVALSERCGLPVWLAPGEGRLGFPQDHPNYRGSLPMSINSISTALAGYDLVLVVGAPVFKYYAYEPGPYLAPGTQIVHVTNDIAEAARAPIGDAVVADVALTLGQLVNQLPCKRMQSPPASPVELPTSEVIGALARALPADAVLVAESATTYLAQGNQIKLNRPGSYYFSSSGGLGFGLPAAIGVQLARPGRPVVAVLGDGAAQYAVAGLWTAAKYRVPVTFVVMNNKEYGILKWFAGLEHVSGVPGLDLGGLDYVSIAHGYGIPAQHVKTATDLEAAIRDAVAAAGPHVIEVDTTVLS